MQVMGAARLGTGGGGSGRGDDNGFTSRAEQRGWGCLKPNVALGLLIVVPTVVLLALVLLMA